jgi:hypothetical protein
MPRIHSEREIGDTAQDGAVLAGISPDTGKPFFAAAADENALMGWEQARRTASLISLRSGVRWRLATDAEHTVLRKNRDQGGLRDTFCDSAWYWSADEINQRKARSWNYGEGSRSEDFKFRPSTVRLVRD